MNDGYTLEDYESELFHDMTNDFKGGGPSSDSQNLDEIERRLSSSVESSSGDEMPDITSSGDEAPEISDSDEDLSQSQPPTLPSSKMNPLI